MSQTQTSVLKTLSVVGVFTIAFVFGFFVLSDHAYAVGKSGNDACKGGWDAACPCDKKMDPMSGQCMPGDNKKDCECQDNTNGQSTTGKCDAPGHCKAEKSSGGGVDSMLQQLGKMLGDALKGLGGGGGGGGGGQPPPTTPTDTGTQTPCGSSTTAGGTLTDNGINGVSGATTPCSSTCTSYYQVSTPSSDPCAYYVPNIADQLTGNTAANDLLNSLNATSSSLGTSTGSGGASGASKQGSLVGLITNPDTLVLGDTIQSIINPNGTSTTAYSFFGQGATTGSTSKDFSLFSTVASLISGSGPGGDLQVGGNGATVSGQGYQNNTAVSGFFGADSTVGGSQGIAGWLCQSRPWASSVFSRIVPSSFFDGLCARNGYQVGLPPVPQATAPVLTQTPVRAPITPATTTTTIQVSTSTGPYVPVQVQIWAVPASVSIGSRTSVFWNARGVTNCIETSPDGSFHQTSLSGGASTVPLTAATTYTISCLAPDGTPATDYFTVRMAI